MSDFKEHYVKNEFISARIEFNYFLMLLDTIFKKKKEKRKIPNNLLLIYFNLIITNIIN